jgi:hypothetical protein
VSCTFLLLSCAKTENPKLPPNNVNEVIGDPNEWTTGLSYDNNGNINGCFITKYLGSNTDVIIPTKINDLNVLGLNKHKLDEEVFGLPISASLESVDMSHAFYLKAIYGKAFNGCVKLKSVRFNDSLEVIDGYDTFFGCAFKELIIPDRVGSINGRTFQYCDKLDTLVLGTELKYLSASFLYACGGPDGVAVTITRQSSNEPTSLGGKADDITNFENSIRRIYYPQGTDYPNYDRWDEIASNLYEPYYKH